MESQRHTLALCIPAYNASRHLPRILTSAKKQTIPFDEVLVYNDCSTDNTAEIAKAFGARVIQGSENRGCTWGRKVLSENVQSDWIHFHDADDDMRENFTELAHKWMAAANPPDVVLFNYDWIDLETGALLGQARFDRAKAERDAVLFSVETQINPFCGLYKTQRFLEAGGPDLDPLVKYYEDAAMHCKLAKAGLTFSVESEVSIINYCVCNSMSRSEGSYVNSVRSVYHTMKKNLEDLSQSANANLYKRAIGMKMWQHTRHAAWVSQWAIVKDCIALAIKCGIRLPESDSRGFTTLCRVSPFGAVFVREHINRLFRQKGQYWY